MNKPRILILNCYDPAHPKSGGAELYLQEIFNRIAAEGDCEVIWFSAAFPEAVGKAVVDSQIKYIRKGNRVSVVFHAAKYYQEHRSEIVKVIDCFHGYSYFSVFYAPREKLLPVIFEYAGYKIWSKVTVFPISALGTFIERFSIRVLYRKLKLITISKSTAADLAKIGHSNSEVIKVGLRSLDSRLRNLPKNKYQLINFGGIRPVKNIETLIESVALIKEVYPQVRLIITGSVHDKNTKYYQQLQSTIRELGLDKNVEFVGFVDESRLQHLIAESYIATGTSIKEGWGMTVSEAGYLGTPSVVFDSPGYRDVVRQDVTGLLTKPTRFEYTDQIIRLFRDDRLYGQLRSAGMVVYERLSWDYSAAEMSEQLGLNHSPK